MKKKKKVFTQAIPKNNKTVWVMFDRKSSFNLLKLKVAMMDLFSKHFTIHLNLNSTLVSIMMKVAKRTKLIKVW